MVYFFPKLPKLTNFKKKIAKIDELPQFDTLFLL